MQFEILKQSLSFSSQVSAEAKARICSTIKENLLLSYSKFSAFVVIVII